MRRASGKFLGLPRIPTTVVSVGFENGAEDMFVEELRLHQRPIMTLAHKKNFIARAHCMGRRLCQNICSCGCGEACAATVCVCGCCGTPYHNDGRYCCACAENLGLDLGRFENEDEHLHAGHSHYGGGCEQNGPIQILNFEALRQAEQRERDPSR